MVKDTKNYASSELHHVPDVRAIQTYERQMYKENTVTRYPLKPKVLRRERTSDTYNISGKRLRIMDSKMALVNSPHLLAGPGGVLISGVLISYRVKTPVKIVALIIIMVMMA